MLEKILSIILNEQLVIRIFLIAGIVGPVLGLLAGFLLGRITGKSREYASKGLFFGLFFTLNIFLYKFYSYMVRYDPETGYVGLHKVSVFLMNIGIFILLGLVLGFLYRLFFKHYET
jgi:NhaP-type Na+/H+ or K+/H+ antiporter